MTGRNDWSECALTPEDVYDRLKAYQEAGMFSYVLPTDPLGEQWILGIEDIPLAKFAGTDIIPFLAGLDTAIKFIARRQGVRLS